ncbi:MAG: heavy-metal-associated domain-containing protein [Sulfuricellaceae bacterium]
MEKITLVVKGMTCMGCVRSVKTVLEPLAGVANVDITLDGGLVAVELDPALVQIDQLKAAIDDAGYEVVA